VPFMDGHSELFWSSRVRMVSSLFGEGWFLLVLPGQSVMNRSPIYPLDEEVGRLVRHCKLDLHAGSGRIAKHGDPSNVLSQIIEHFQRASGKHVVGPSEIEFAASCVVPAEGNCLLFLQNESGVRLNRLFGEGLTITGENADGSFELNCPRFYVEDTSPASEDPAWAIASPVNSQVGIKYGNPRPTASVTAIINNFDFEYGNVSLGHEQTELLRIQGWGRTVEFVWREDHQRLKQLLNVGVLRTSALTTFSFAAWEGATEEDLSAFAYGIASLCGIVAQQHTGIPILTFLDKDGRVIKRLLNNAVESDFRSDYCLRFLHFEGGLPQVFAQCFDEHMKMLRSDLWKRLPWLLAGIEDPPYLEQKSATLMAALELFIRSSLVEAGICSLEKASQTMFPGLISAARKKLHWDIPPHYTQKERYRLLRNAVAHGGQLPGEIKQVRHDFDKWRLFLLRRLLLRLGFNGEVASPEQGCASSSSVGDFTERHNSFET